MMSRARQTDYKKIHIGSVASSRTMARRSMSSCSATARLLDSVTKCIALTDQPDVIGGPKNEIVFYGNGYRSVPDIRANDAA
jgi:hypothetical protein